MEELFFIGALLAVIAYWWDTTVTNELALQACQRICENAHMQLLDSTIMRQRIWLRRASSGGFQICRLYSFEYTEDSETRQHGYVVTIGRQVVETQMQAHPLH